MKTDLNGNAASLRVVLPPDCDPCPLRVDEFLLGHHLPDGAALPERAEWPRWAQNFREEILYPEEGFETFFLIGPENEVRGWVMAETNRLDVNQNLTVPFLSDLVVLRPWRGRGYGRFLVRRVENFFIQRGKLDLHVICPFELVAWFSAQGYEILPREEQDEALMRKNFRWKTVAGTARTPR